MIPNFLKRLNSAPAMLHSLFGQAKAKCWVLCLLESKVNSSPLCRQHKLVYVHVHLIIKKLIQNYIFPVNDFKIKNEPS